MPCSPGNLFSCLELPPADMLVPGEVSRSLGWCWFWQRCHRAAAPSCLLPHMVFPIVLQLQHQGGGRAGHGPAMARGEAQGLWPGWIPPRSPTAPALEQQLCMDLWKVWGLPKGICVQVLPWLFSSLQSRPLHSLLTHGFFLALLPYPSCPFQSWLLTRNTLSHHRAFPRQLSSLFTRGAACRVCVPAPIPRGCFCLLLSRLSLPMYQDPALVGRRWHLGLSLLASTAIP